MYSSLNFKIKRLMLWLFLFVNLKKVSFYTRGFEVLYLTRNAVLQKTFVRRFCFSPQNEVLALYA
jgi:hypothetical protein